MQPAIKPNGAQTLLIDLDDTLWENNVYFERAIAAFMDYLNHRHMSVAEVREVLNRVEKESILEHGYGLHSFTHSLVTTFERLSERAVTDEVHQTIVGFAHQIADHPMEIITGVAETLDYLSGRHHLIVMTKGKFTEQTSKVERSGLKEYFAAVEVVPEKNAAAYNEITGKYALALETTWMVGNSPKSDINPALAAGLHAVFVPHDMTWVLEHEELAPVPSPSQTLLQLERFAQLQDHF
ncbi:MAG: HAD family hydrolase [Acidobacteriales bacterium]|nr:HAD family hydrolase [Terriglobales bacterium]